MKKVLVLGPSGGGKSTFSRKLGELLSLPIVHLDSHYWQENWTPTEREVWREKCRKMADEPEWVMDGNYRSSIDIRLPKADTVIFLDTPTLKSFFRVFKRLMEFRGRVRPELKKGCREKMDWDFFKWILFFNRKNRPEILDLLKSVENDIDVHILKTEKERDDFLEMMKS